MSDLRPSHAPDRNGRARRARRRIRPTRAAPVGGYAHRALRRDRDRRRPGGSRYRLPPTARRTAIPDPRRRRTDRRSVAPALGLTATLHALALRRAVGHDVSGPSVVFPDQGPTWRSYLEAYAAKFALPVRLRSRVERLSKKTTCSCCKARFHAARRPGRRRDVELSTPPRARIRTRAEAWHRPAALVRLSEPAQLGRGGVLVVGAGNSGAEIALELARSRPVWLSGRDVGAVPFDIEGTASRRPSAARDRVRVSPRDHKRRRSVARSGRVHLARRAADSNQTRRARGRRRKRVARVVGARDGLPVLDDGSVLDVGTVIWGTGLHHGLEWIELPVIGSTASRGTRAVCRRPIRASTTSANISCTRSRRR